MSSNPTPITYLPYADSLEQPAPDEQQTIAELGQVMHTITSTMAARYRHAYRPVHAKSHAVVKAMLDVKPGLPPELAQGLFARPATYGVLMRFSTNPGDMLADTVSSPRGLAIKVLGVNSDGQAGEALPGYSGAPASHSQDFVCINGNVFTAPDPAGFLKGIKLFEKTLTTPEPIKHGVSLAARATNAVLKTIGLPSATLEGMGAAATHPLGESFTTVSPLRYGSYVAKIGFAPGNAALTGLTGKSIDLDRSYNALEDYIRDFFQTGTGVWDVKVQLALDDLETFPIEKADVEWPEDASPWITVATITALPQNTYSDARQLFVDEQVGFNPWHGLAAHRPLGGIQRARKFAYEEAQKYRAQRNARERIEPKSLTEIPD